jgi:hypothetical protein
MSEAETHDLASQNQLYAVLMLSCSAWRVKKPHKRLLSLVDDIESHPAEVAKREAGNIVDIGPTKAAAESRTAAVRDYVEQADGAAMLASPSTVIGTTVAPLSTLTFIDMGQDYYGNANLCVLLDLMAHLPLVERVDWSEQKIFGVDAYKLGVSGNEVVRRLFLWAARQRNLKSVHLGPKNPVGTRLVHYMIDAVKANPSLVDVTFDESGIEAFLLQQFHRALDANREGRSKAHALPPYYRLTQELREHDVMDRKTSADRRELYALLRESHASFLDVLEPIGEGEGQSSDPDGERRRMASSMDAISAPGASDAMALGFSAGERVLTSLVAQSHRRSSAECVGASRGLRGDGGSLYLVDAGSLVAHVGGHDLVLARGDYFGEVLESEMYVAGQLGVAQRGSAFQIPHAVADPIMRAWEQRVLAFLPILKQVAVLQPLPSWCLIRACHDAKLVNFAKGAVVINKGQGFAGLSIVTKGVFMVRGRAKLGKGQVTFTRGDVFGEEAAVSRLGVSSVEIKTSTEDPAAAAEEDSNQVLLLSARHVKAHIVPHIRGVLAVHAKSYSDNV